MIDKLHLIYFQRTLGPGKVVGNLRLGLRRIGVDEISLDKAQHVACLQWDDTDLDDEKHYTLDQLQGKKVLFGPNIWVEPNERPELYNQFSDFIVPSEWVKDYQSSYECMEGKNIHVWPVGIDTDKWKPNWKKPLEFDAFMYYKNRDKEDAAEVCDHLVDLDIEGHMLVYGKYPETHFLEFCHRSKAAIILNGTESQGIAYMQMLSSGIPCLVFNKNTWSSPSGNIHPATSVPYFDERCGMVTDEINKDVIAEFMHNVNSGIYNPREFILENHTVEKAAQKYLEILENVTVQ